MNNQQQPILDLSKTVPISEQEQKKLSAFLNNLQNNIKGGPVGKWSKQLQQKQKTKQQIKQQNKQIKKTGENTD